MTTNGLLGLLGLIAALAGGGVFYWILSLGDNDHDDKTGKMG